MNCREYPSNSYQFCLKTVFLLEGYSFLEDKMSKILILAEDEKTLSRWNGILSIASDHHDMEVQLIDSFTIDIYDFEEVVTVMVVNELKPFSDEIPEILELCQNLKIPVVVSKSIAGQFDSIAMLMSMGISAIIDINMSILRISNLIKIVENGGVFLDPKMLIHETKL